MMKKQGFTLAEVLITLTIIGVIATMTLPSLMTNTAEQQYKTGLKKGVNTLTEAAQMHEAIEGFNYANLTDANDVATAGQATAATEDEVAKNSVQSLVGMLRERTKLDIGKTVDQPTHTIGVGTDANPLTEPKAIYFMDGTSLFFDASAQTPAAGATYSATDNLPVGFKIIFDTNGTKGPNQIANCKAASGGGIDVGGSVDDEGNVAAYDLSKCTNKQTRAIRDQFVLQVRGNVVQPVGEAASWALSE